MYVRRYARNITWGVYTADHECLKMRYCRMCAYLVEQVRIAKISVAHATELAAPKRPSSGRGSPDLPRVALPGISKAPKCYSFDAVAIATASLNIVPPIESRRRYRRIFTRYSRRLWPPRIGAFVWQLALPETPLLGVDGPLTAPRFSRRHGGVWPATAEPRLSRRLPRRTSYLSSEPCCGRGGALADPVAVPQGVQLVGDAL